MSLLEPEPSAINIDTTGSSSTPKAVVQDAPIPLSPQSAPAHSTQSQVYSTPTGSIHGATPDSTSTTGMKSSVLADNVERGPLGLLPNEEEWVKDKMEYALHDFEVLSLAIKRYKWQLSQVPKDISRLQDLKEKHAQDPFEFLRQIRSKEFRYPEGQRTLPAPTIEWSKYHYPPANPISPTRPQHATYLGTGFFPSTNDQNNNNVVAISSTNDRSRAGSPSYERLRTVKEAARNLGIHTSRHHHQASGQDIMKENGRSQNDDAVEIRNSRPSTPETGKWNRDYSKSPGVVAQPQDMEGVTFSAQPDTPLAATAQATPESLPTETLPQPAPVSSEQNPPFLHQNNSNNNITYNHMNGSIDIQPGKAKAYSREGSGVRDDPKPLLYNIPWSDEEQKLLERLLDEYPDEPVAAQRFQKISLAMGTRTPKQVASRVQKYFIKLVKAGLEAPGRMNYSLEPAKPKIKGASPNAKTKKRKEAPAAGEGSTSKGKAVARGKKKEEGAVKKQKPKSGGVGRISGAQYLHYSAAPSVYMSEDDDEDSVQDMIAVSTSTPGSDGGIASHIGFACESCGVDPILGTRYSCVECEAIGGVDLCGPCYNMGAYQTDHHLVTHQFHVLEAADAPSFQHTYQPNHSSPGPSRSGGAGGSSSHVHH
ncbi:ZZ-type zinc finger-containing protein 3 [Podila minutissima]|nr:ZZ-type zinc finger-containing protein 3 [Podila minutissima]